MLKNLSQLLKNPYNRRLCLRLLRSHRHLVRCRRLPLHQSKVLLTALGVGVKLAVLQSSAEPPRKKLKNLKAQIAVVKLGARKTIAVPASQD
jgi:hypothetical protein